MEIVTIINEAGIKDKGFPEDKYISKDGILRHSHHITI